jgi:hypothetical protein
MTDPQNHAVLQGLVREMSGNVTKMSARSIGRVLEKSFWRGRIPCKEGVLRRVMDNFGRLAQHVVRGVYFWMAGRQAGVEDHAGVTPRSARLGSPGRSGARPYPCTRDPIEHGREIRALVSVRVNLVVCPRERVGARGRRAGTRGPVSPRDGVSLTRPLSSMPVA